MQSGTAVGAYAVFECVDTFAASGDESDRSAEFGEALCGGGTDPTGGSGDDGYSAGEGVPAMIWAGAPPFRTDPRVPSAHLATDTR